MNCILLLVLGCAIAAFPKANVERPNFSSFLSSHDNQTKAGVARAVAKMQAEVARASEPERALYEHVAMRIEHRMKVVLIQEAIALKAIFNAAWELVDHLRHIQEHLTSPRDNQGPLGMEILTILEDFDPNVSLNRTSEAKIKPEFVLSFINQWNTENSLDKPPVKPWVVRYILALTGMGKAEAIAGTALHTLVHPDFYKKFRGFLAEAVGPGFNVNDFPEFYGNKTQSIMATDICAKLVTAADLNSLIETTQFLANGSLDQMQADVISAIDELMATLEEREETLGGLYQQIRGQVIDLALRAHLAKSGSL